jgi:hypothetical protein
MSPQAEQTLQRIAIALERIAILMAAQQGLTFIEKEVK